jgi:N-acetylglucosamine-6-phosphate deacetylase
MVAAAGRPAARRLYAVTVGTSATGMSDGEYCGGSQSVEKCVDGVRVAEFMLASSTLTMDQTLRNLLSIGLLITDVSNRAR